MRVPSWLHAAIVSLKIHSFSCNTPGHFCFLHQRTLPQNYQVQLRSLHKKKIYIYWALYWQFWVKLVVKLVSWFFYLTALIFVLLRFFILFVILLRLFICRHVQSFRLVIYLIIYNPYYIMFRWKILHFSKISSL